MDTMGGRVDTYQDTVIYTVFAVMSRLLSLAFFQQQDVGDLPLCSFYTLGKDSLLICESLLRTHGMPLNLESFGAHGNHGHSAQFPNIRRMLGPSSHAQLLFPCIGECYARALILLAFGD